MSNPENPTPDLIARGIPKDAVKVVGDEAILPTDFLVDHAGKIEPNEDMEGLNASDWMQGGYVFAFAGNTTNQSAVYRVTTPAPVADAGAGNRSPYDVASDSIDKLRAENIRLAKDAAHLTRESDRYKSAIEKERQQRIDYHRANVARFQPVLDAAKGAGWKPGEETIGEFVARVIDERDANDATLDSAAYRSIEDRDMHIKRAEAERDAALARESGYRSALVAAESRIAALEAAPLPADLDELDTRLIGVAVWSAHLLPVPTAAGLDVTPEAVESVREEMDQARAALRALAADRGRLREATNGVEGRIEQAVKFINDATRWDQADESNPDGDGKTILAWILKDVNAALAPDRNAGKGESILCPECGELPPNHNADCSVYAAELAAAREGKP